MNRNLLILLALIATLSSCSRNPAVKRSENVITNYSKLAYHNHRLELRSMNMKHKGGRDEGINHVTVEYYAYQLMEVEDARRVITETAEGLLQSMNNDDELRPLILDYPLTVENMTITIEIEHFFGQYFEPIYLGYVALEDEHVSYYDYDKKLVRREPYDEAVRDVADEDRRELENAMSRNWKERRL